MPACAHPDTSLGVVLRLSTYLDCQARALGEDGFLALIGDPVVTGLLSALVTIFVALIGYRLIVGQVPGLSDGLGWAVRLGFVLALVTGWPAFQTLLYRVAVDGPAELAAVLLPAANLPAEGLDARVQQAYDTMRLGAAGQPGAANPEQQQPQTGQQPQAGVGAAPPTPTGFGPYAQPALPQTAAIFAVSTVGVGAALRIAVGLLLALAPIAIMGLLFDATLGLCTGFIRALGGSALALVGANLVTALDLILVEGELGNWQAIERGVTVIDPQGLTTVVLCFLPVMLAAVGIAMRMAGSIRLLPRIAAGATTETVGTGGGIRVVDPLRSAAASPVSPTAPLVVGHGRAQSVADALSIAVQRERAAATSGLVEGRLAIEGGGPGERATSSSQPEQGRGSVDTSRGRRAAGRQSRSAARRDRA